MEEEEKKSCQYIEPVQPPEVCESVALTAAQMIAIDSDVGGGGGCAAAAGDCSRQRLSL